MATITVPIPVTVLETLTLFYAIDPLLSNAPILVFYGPSTTTNSTLNGSRIQTHILTPAGFHTFPRLTVSPNSPLYAAVNHLPREQQGDEICRGLAVSLLKYFAELPDIVKSTWAKSTTSGRGRVAAPAPVVFDEMHAGDLASRMVKVENSMDIIKDLKAGLAVRVLSHIDMDVVLPPGLISQMQPEAPSDEEYGEEDDDPTLCRYGDYAHLIRILGAPVFIPTSKLRRAPSKPTALGRTKSFLKHQKENVRREMCELVDTEERYVGKIHELVHEVAFEFRQKAKGKGPGSSSPNQASLEKLFSPSLDQIYDVNSQFLTAVRDVLDETENEAIENIQADNGTGSTGSRTSRSGRGRDSMGALVFAKVLLHWLPKFSDCYSQYMRAHSSSLATLSGYLRETGSSFSKRVQQTGEQRLRSMLAEPLQRLPRYNLFIDNIVKSLPVSHPALQPLLKARDIISDICSMDLDASTEKSQVVHRLRNLIASWPPSLQPEGRLIAVVDFAEVPPPYHADCQPGLEVPGMFLLFAGVIIIIRKQKGATMTSRGLIAEVDRPSQATNSASIAAAATGSRTSYDLVFSGWLSLCDVRFCESNCGRLAWMTFAREPLDLPASARRSGPGVRAFRLTGSYEGKASRWSEEIAKARVEGRFSEEERERESWSLRSVVSRDESIGLWSAIHEEGSDGKVSNGKDLAMIRMIVDGMSGAKTIPVGTQGVEIAISICLEAEGRYCLEIDALNDYASVDKVNSTDLSSVLFKKISTILRLQNQPQNPALTAALLSMNGRILRSLTYDTVQDEEEQEENGQTRTRSFRPPSPVKLLHSFLGGGSSITGSSTASKQLQNPLNETPSMPPPARLPTGENGILKRMQDDPGQKINGIGENYTPGVVDMIRRLEETFQAYVMALHLRRGNVVDKVLRGRRAADELVVNELYNALLENPSRGEYSAEVSVDVLFAAFEKFLQSTWKEQFGPIVSIQTLNSIQDKSDVLLPRDFEDCFKMVLGEMSPQNRRAFKAIIKLLACLLDGAGNDGDKGALMATFTELLVPDGLPHQYISLLDRLVDDYDRLFNETPPGSRSGEATPSSGSVNSFKRGRSVNTGSISSNTSSLRKRFGFNTLSRENSKVDSDSKVSSVWRTLSKSTRSAATVESNAANSKRTLVRSRSIELDPRALPVNQPPSRDRPTVFGTFSFEDSSRPGSSDLSTAFSSITASSPVTATPSKAAPRKKRRSSLSDLKTLKDFESPVIAPLTPRKPNTLESSPFAFATKSANATAYSSGLSNKKENVPTASRTALTTRSNTLMSDDVVIAEIRPSRRDSPSLSGIPTLKALSREDRQEQSNRSGQSAPQRLRMQSPQKLRERLQNEQKTLSRVEDSLQAEISKIGEEISRTGLGRAPSRSQSTEVRQLLDRINQVESRIPIFITDLTARNNSIKNDLESSLAVSESKAKKLDELYREANAENEILYDHFHSELQNMVSAMRSGAGEKELARKLKEMQGELTACKKENARLKRENAGLRAQLKGA